MIYIRARDGESVDRSEACTAAGTVKQGYSARAAMVADGERASFFASFLDSAPMADAATALTDAERSVVVAHARRQHDARYAYLGSLAPSFTDAQASDAVAQAVGRKRAATVAPSTTLVRTAQTMTSRAMLAEANRKRKTAVANAWRR